MPVLNRYEAARMPGEAKVRYKDGDYEVLVGGSHVRCAVTGTLIAVDEIRYWSVAYQEPYIDAAASLKAHMRRAG
jgi:hypothetical protein